MVIWYPPPQRRSHRVCLGMILDMHQLNKMPKTWNLILLLQWKGFVRSNSKIYSNQKNPVKVAKTTKTYPKPQLLWSFGFIHHYFLSSSTSPFHDRPIVFSSRFSLHQFPAVSSMETKLAKHPQAGAQFGFATLQLLFHLPSLSPCLHGPWWLVVQDGTMGWREGLKEGCWRENCLVVF